MAARGEGRKGEGGEALELAFHPLTPDRWHDFEVLFGRGGAWGGCWCMWWRLTAADFDRLRGEETKARMRALVEQEPPGILAYHGDRPVGWCALAPREAYGRLERSPVLKRVDEEAVWSVTCFYVARAYRGKGVSEALLRAALDHARDRGARIVEGYPIVPRNAKVPGMVAWTGFASTFAKVGFREVARHKETRPIVRYVFPEG